MWGTYLALRLSPALAPWLAVYSFLSIHLHQVDVLQI